jgi:hypothetical protein
MHNTGYGFRCVASGMTFVTNMVQLNGIGMSFEDDLVSTVSTGFVNLNGVGVELINTKNMLIFSTPIQLSTIKDIKVDVNSSNNIIAHNFFNTYEDLGTGNRWQNNHKNTPILDTDVATVLYAKDISRRGVFEIDSLGDLTLANTVQSNGIFEDDNAGDLMPVGVNQDENFEWDVNGDVEPKS